MMEMPVSMPGSKTRFACLLKAPHRTQNFDMSELSFLKLAAREILSCLSHASLHVAGGWGSLSYLVHASLLKRGLSEDIW